MSIEKDNATGLFDKNVDIAASAVMYNIRGTTIEEFVEDYLTKKNIDGVEAVVLKTKQEGHNAPEVVLYLFMSINSRFIKSSANNVPANLREKMESVKVDITEDFKKVLLPICGMEIECGKNQGNKICFVKLDVFRVAALMFAADPRKHRIIISDVARIPQDKDSILTIVKQIRYNGNQSNDNTQKYSRLVDDIEDDNRGNRRRF